MKNKLQSALILLNNVYFENKKFTRETLAEKFKEEGFSHSKNTITELLKFIDQIFGIELSFRNREGIVKILEDDQNHYHFIKTLILNVFLLDSKNFGCIRQYDFPSYSCGFGNMGRSGRRTIHNLVRTRRNFNVD